MFKLDDDDMQRHLLRIVTGLSLGLTMLLLLGCGSNTPDSGGASGEGDDEDDLSNQLYQGMQSQRLGPHTATFHAEFAPSDGSTGWVYNVSSRINDPSASMMRDLQIEGLSSGKDPGDVTLVLVGKTQYMVGQGVGEGLCFLFPVGVDLEDSFLTPDTFLEAHEVDDEVLARAGEQDIAGQKGTGFNFQADAVGDFTNVEGTIVLSGEGAVLQYTFAGDTVEDTMLDGVPGRLSWQYSVEQFGAGETISVPSECLIDLPMTADAERTVRLPGVIQYETQSTLEEITAFYEKAMVEQGWSVYEFPQVRDDAVVLTYARSGQILNISIKEDEDNNLVRLFIEPDPAS